MKAPRIEDHIGYSPTKIGGCSGKKILGRISSFKLDGAELLAERIQIQILKRLHMAVDDLKTFAMDGSIGQQKMQQMILMDGYSRSRGMSQDSDQAYLGTDTEQNYRRQKMLEKKKELAEGIQSSIMKFKRVKAIGQESQDRQHKKYNNID